VGGVAVVTDSTASLDPVECAAAGIRVVPLQVVIDGVSRPEDEIASGQVAAALRGGRRVSTSRPTPDAFAAGYDQAAQDGFESVVSVHLSGQMSGTVAAAELAAQSAPVPVTVVDSRSIALAQGFAVLAGAAAARAGAGAAEVAEVVRRRAAAATTYFSVASLEYLRRGGRIGAAAALLGSALAVKPLLTLREGAIQPYERVRTTSRARARLVELALAASAAGLVDVAVVHLADPAGAAELAGRLAGRVQTEVVIAELSAVVGVHVGPGTLGVVVAPRG
jgi:DegV family protein with EDD domain